MYQLRRLIFGKARSLAPIIKGIRKLPRTEEIEGIRKKKTMATPCMVKSLLYVSGVTKAPVGVRRWIRIIVAKSPPMKKKKVTDPSHSRAMRLWSVVSSHERRPYSAFR